MGANLDEIRQLVREGKLVPVGSRRDAFLARSERGDPPQPGDILAGPFLVVSVEEATEVGWGLKVRRLVPPRAPRTGWRPASW